MNEKQDTAITYIDTTYFLWGGFLLISGWLIKSLNKANKAEIDKIESSIHSLQVMIQADKAARAEERKGDRDYIKEILDLRLKPIEKDIHAIKNDQAAREALKNLLHKAENKSEYVS